MSDEDSFVILGSTPTASMEPFSMSPVQPRSAFTMSSVQPRSDFTPMSSLQPTGNALSLLQNETEAISPENQPFSILQYQDESEKAASISPYKSLAEQFIMGQIDVASLKSSVSNKAQKTDPSSMNHQQNVQFTSISQHFPSMCTPQSSEEDLQKLESLICEHLELKDNLEKTNIAMRQHFSLISQWHANVIQLKTEKTTEIQQLKDANNELQNEIQNLKDGHTNELQNYKTVLEIAQKENSDLVKEISNSKAIIQNMHSEIAKFHNDTAAYSLMHDSASSMPSQQDSIDLKEHEEVVKKLNIDLSKSLAENLELQDMKKVYIDQVNCLQVNMVATGELLNKAQADINLLKSKEEETRITHADKEKRITDLKAEVDLLKAQLEIYRNDFEMERSSRQDLASEREEILTDLKLLQRRNQQLIDEAQARSIRDVAGPSVRAAILTTPKPSTGQFICPVCSRTYVELKALESHVNDCLLNM